MLTRRKNAPDALNVSALDLFASAMGTFILIAIVLFPYYLNTKDAAAAAKQQAAEIEALQRKAAQAKARAAKAKREAAKAKAEAACHPINT